jgi:hypothetical protein
MFLSDASGFEFNAANTIDQTAVIAAMLPVCSLKTATKLAAVLFVVRVL